MMEAKFDIKKFDRTGDFGLWRIKMRALLIQYGCEAALEVLPADMEAEAKAELNKKAHNAVILCFSNKVLREVTGETTTAGVWTKLETLYMTKSLANKLKKSLRSSEVDFEIFVGYCKRRFGVWDTSWQPWMCCKLEGNATIRGGVYGSYGGCEGNYLAKRTLGRVLEAKTIKVLKVGTEHNAADALTKVVPRLTIVEESLIKN
ncbi:hypothetical protein Tco_1035428 [Tanacetum coccineum]